MITQLGSGLVRLGLAPGSFVGIFSQNRAEWVVAEQACHAYSLVPVPLYDTLGDDAVQFILAQAELAVVICSEDKVRMLRDAAKSPGARLAHLVTMDGVAALLAASGPPSNGSASSPPASGAGADEPTAPLPVLVTHGSAESAVTLPSHAHGGTVRSNDVPAALSSSSLSSGRVTPAREWRMSEVLAVGRRSPLPHRPPTPGDLATVCYTSGTTGDPKGAMLTHANFAAAVAGSSAAGVRLTPEDVHLSYLPLAHVFERIVQVSVFHNGGAVGFFSGDVTLLLDDLATLRPTVFPSVPRLFNRIFDKLSAGVRAAGGLKQALFEYAYASKAYYLEEGHTSHSVWDALVFARLRELLGGRVRLMLTGSAPISPAVKEFLQVVFCAPVGEGYGLTETVGVATLTPLDGRHPGQVGPVCACCELKLVDVSEMNYTSKDTPHPRGEVCIRGPNVFVGYYRSPDKTREAIDDDGWFHTGDIGRINEDGTLSIIDRKKNIFKLAQGEYIAPEKIEGIYMRSPLVAQCFLHGESVKSSAVAVVVPDPEVVGPWAQKHSLAGSSLADWVQSPELRAAIEASMREVADAAGLKGFERARAVHVVAEPFSVENDLLTPTFKLKRPQIRDRFKTEIEAMYASLGE